MPRLRIHHRRTVSLKDERGSALLEFAVSLPLLVVFVVGIYDFSGASNQKQKIEQAAEEGAVLAGAQPRSDVQQTAANQVSMQPVVVAIFNSLAASGVLPNANTGGGCLMPPPAPSSAGPLAWTYKISGCSAYPSDQLVITISRGWVCPPPCAAGPPMALGTSVTVTYPYHWQFNSVVQLLVPGASYAAITQLTETATVHNQL
jgi:TadE-like protein